MTSGHDKHEEGSAGQSGGGSCCSGPGKWIGIALILAVAGVLFAKNAGEKRAAESTRAAGMDASAVEAAGTKSIPDPANMGIGIPRLVDLGATECIPCKLMAPILEDLKKTYAGTLDVQFIDVWENPDAGTKFAINVIPTQIFYDAQGKELLRHEGFFGKEDILATWRKFGVNLAGTPAAPGVNP